MPGTILATSPPFNFLTLGMEASAARERRFGTTATFCGAALLYTGGSCGSDCVLCRMFGRGELDTVMEPVSAGRELLRGGISEVVLHGGAPAAGDGDAGDLEEVEAWIRELTAMGLQVHGFDSSELRRLAARTARPGDSPRAAMRELLGRLRSAGLLSLFGGAWESEEDRALLAAAAELELTAHATLDLTRVGDDLPPAFDRLRNVAEQSPETISSVLIWYLLRSHKQPPAAAGENGCGGGTHTVLAPSSSTELTATEFLAAVAQARLALPSIPHVQAAWCGPGMKSLQMALEFGADDIGVAVHSGRAVSVEGVRPREEELRRLIRDAGLRPARRDFAFRSCALV
jgi:cyclic dehypoxanthinyl futalosine synthase